MWGPKCEKVRKPWVLRLKRWILSMRVSELRNIRGSRTCDCVVTHASSCVFYPFRNWEPVELL